MSTTKCNEVKRRLMDEGHNTPYFVHPEGDKLYKDLNIRRSIGGQL